MKKLQTKDTILIVFLAMVSLFIFGVGVQVGNNRQSASQFSDCLKKEYGTDTIAEVNLNYNLKAWENYTKSIKQDWASYSCPKYLGQQWMRQPDFGKSTYGSEPVRVEVYPWLMNFAAANRFADLAVFPLSGLLFLILSVVSTFRRKLLKRESLVWIAMICFIACGALATGWTVIQFSGRNLSSDDLSSIMSYVITPDGTNFLVTRNDGETLSGLSGPDAVTVIQNTINELTSGGRILLRNGTYLLTRDGNNSYGISIPYSNVDLSGEGPGTILRVADGTQINAIYASDVSDIFIHDLEIDGNKANNTDGGVDANQNGILLDYVTYSKITHVWSMNNIKSGVLLQGSSTNNVIAENHLNSNGVYGFNEVRGSTYNVVANNNAKDNAIEQLHCCETSDDLYVGNNVSGGNYGIHTNNSTNIVIADNIVSSAKYEGILIDYSATYHTISGNTVRNSRIGIMIDGSDSPSANNIVTGNTVKGNSDHGIVLKGSNLDAVIGNVIAKNQYHGILICDSDNNLVTNNVISSNSPENAGIFDGIHIQNSSDRNDIKLNKINDNLKQAYGIRIEAGCTSNYITNNDLTDSGLLGYISDEGTATKIKANEGYVTENSGTVTIANNEWVPHGLATTPTKVLVTTRNATYEGVAVVVGWAGQNSTHFRVSAYLVNSTAITDDAINISWYAEV